MDLSKLSQFGNLISELGSTSAKQTNDKSKIDDKSELNLFTSGWEAIQSKAKNEGADEMDMHTLEVRMRSEFAELLGVDFGKSASVEPVENENGEFGFTSDEISLENMMSYLSEDDGIDMNKLREYNKKPMMSEVDSMDKLTGAGFSEELADILMEETPGAVRYITNSIKDGSMDRIEAKTKRLEELGIDVNTVNLGAFMEELIDEGFLKQDKD
jgi:hypothetical protein